MDEGPKKAPRGVEAVVRAFSPCTSGRLVSASLIRAITLEAWGTSARVANGSRDGHSGLARHSMLPDELALALSGTNSKRPAGANPEWDLAYAATHSINIPLASAADACLCFE